MLFAASGQDLKIKHRFLTWDLELNALHSSHEAILEGCGIFEGWKEACRRQLIEGESTGDHIPGCILSESLVPGQQ